MSPLGTASVLAIDPGPVRSAFVRVRDGMIVGHGIVLNDAVPCGPSGPDEVLVIEMVQGYGAPVGAETFETCVWIGRFLERWDAKGWQLRLPKIGEKDAVRTPVLLSRGDVKAALCPGVAKVNDAVIRQRLIDLYGPGKAIAISSKARPGPLYGIRADEWQALALAVAHAIRSGGR